LAFKCAEGLTEEKDIIVAPEGHHDSRRLVQRDRLDILQPSNLPHPNLPIAHPAKSRRSDTIAVSGFSAGAGIEQIRKPFESRSSNAHQTSNPAQPTNAEDKDPDHRSRKGHFELFLEGGETVV